VAVQMGRHLARIVYAIRAVGLVVVIVRMSILNFGTASPIWLIFGLVGAGTLAASVVLLLGPAAGAWFDHGGARSDR